jgi:hypothetical protein
MPEEALYWTFAAFPACSWDFSDENPFSNPSSNPAACTTAWQPAPPHPVPAPGAWADLYDPPAGLPVGLTGFGQYAGAIFVGK